MIKSCINANLNPCFNTEAIPNTVLLDRGPFVFRLPSFNFSEM